MFGLSRDDAAIGAVLVLLVIAGLGSDKRRKPVPPERLPIPFHLPVPPGATARQRWDPMGYRKLIAEAVASGDPIQMRQLAEELRREGYKAEAQYLEEQAAAVESPP